MFFRMITIDTAISDFLAARRAERLSENTISGYRFNLARFTAFIGEKKNVSSIHASDISEFLAEQDDVCDETVRKYHIALCSLWTWMIGQGIAKTNIPRQVNPPKPVRREIVPFTQEDISQLLLATDQSIAYLSPNGKMIRNACRAADRDRAVIYILLDTGLRVSEMCGIRKRDLDADGVKVLGKGKRERWVPIGPTAMAFLGIYTDIRALESDDLVFPISRYGVTDLLKRLEARADVKDVHAHRFRHTFAITYLRNGGDPYTLQRILGHSTMEMTKRYLAIANYDLKRVHSRCSPVENWIL